MTPDEALSWSEALQVGGGWTLSVILFGAVLYLFKKLEAIRDTYEKRTLDMVKEQTEILTTAKLQMTKLIELMTQLNTRLK